MKKVAILQSNYIPWKGYFDLIASVDEFIIYDEMQYTKNDWRNRNKIKSPKGLHWLTISVKQLSLSQKINETEVFDKLWAKKHLETIKQFYKPALCFTEQKQYVQDLYMNCTSESLSEINIYFIRHLCDFLGINTKITSSTDYGLIEGKTERLIDLVKKAKGTHYISGPAAKDYLNESLFTDAGINLSWIDYSKYKEYPQLYPPFEHGVSIIDLILNTGKEAGSYIFDSAKN